MLGTRGTYQRILVGIAAMLAVLAVLLVILLAFRPNLSIALPALMFVLPAVVGTVIGGFPVGVVGAVAGFLAYDYYFLPPYGTLTVRSPQNWIALVVYVVVVLIVAQVVSQLGRAREVALRQTEESNRLYDLSSALIGDLTLAELLTHVVSAVQNAFAPRWTALLLPENDNERPQASTLGVAAHAGEPLTEADVRSLTSVGGHTVSLGLDTGPDPHRVSLALVVAHRPVGMLVLQHVQLAPAERGLLGTFANQVALAVDRALLREQALRARLLEEIDRWRSALMGAASHDLRTPLASIKTAVSSLRQVDTPLGPDDRAELLELIELQTDRLARLVTNLLDMTRIQSGALQLRPAAIAFDELVDEARGLLGGLLAPERISLRSSEDLPLLLIDHPLVSQVLANVLENAGRLSPPESVIRVAARPAAASPGMVEISVSDEGPGIPRADQERVFEMFSQNGGGGRAGLGLAIAKAFVEAHGGRIWIDPAMQPGARVVFTVPGQALVPASV
jgi:two-component system sensor histidine kinase KdpD